MSTVESLLGEVTPLLESRITIAAADQLFFGDSVLYAHHSNEGPTTSKGDEHAGHGKDHKKGKKGHGKEHHESHGHHHHHHHQDGLHAAIANVKETVKKALQGEEAASGERPGFEKVLAELAELRKDNAAIHAELAELRQKMAGMGVSAEAKVAPTAAPAKPAAAAPAAKADDDDFDLFDSSDEEVDEEKERIKQERLKAYAEKKAKKPAGIAKSSVILDIKPWDDETNMEEMENMVRAIEKEGLVWGGGKLIPLAYGIKKLQIICVIEDEKVSVEDLIDRITEDIADHVQSVDIHAFNKI